MGAARIPNAEASGATAASSGTLASGRSRARWRGLGRFLLALRSRTTGEDWTRAAGRDRQPRQRPGFASDERFVAI